MKAMFTAPGTHLRCGAPPTTENGLCKTKTSLRPTTLIARSTQLNASRRFLPKAPYGIANLWSDTARFARCTEIDFALIQDAPLYVASKPARSPQFGEDSNSGWSCWTLSATLRKACAHAEEPLGGETEGGTGGLLGMGRFSFGAGSGLLASERAVLSRESWVRALTGAE